MSHDPQNLAEKVIKYLRYKFHENDSNKGNVILGISSEAWMSLIQCFLELHHLVLQLCFAVELTRAPIGGKRNVPPSIFLPIAKNKMRHRRQTLYTHPIINFTHPDKRNFSML